MNPSKSCVLLHDPLGVHSSRGCSQFVLFNPRPMRRTCKEIPRINSVHTRGIVKKRGFTRGVAKIGDLIKNLRVFSWNS